MIRVLQLIDSLEAGGAERLSVNMANVLEAQVEASFLCVTRAEGILKDTIEPNVSYLFLQKTSRLNLKALFRLNKFIKDNRINVIHAHSTSFFFATLIKILQPNIKLVWHDHFGNSEFLQDRPKRILKFCSKYFHHIFCVNQDLLHWSKQNLRCKHMSYLQNFAILQKADPVTELSGLSGKRIVCLANLRPQKDHFTLLKAFNDVIEEHPDWTLHCVGKDFKDAYANEILKFVNENKLSQHVYFYGSRPDINHILSQSEIGILSSKSEGLPIALLEYGYAGLPVIVTDTGDCNRVVNSKDLGMLTESENVEALKNALLHYIENERLRNIYAKNLHEKVVKDFSKESVLKELLKVYEK